MSAAELGEMKSGGFYTLFTLTLTDDNKIMYSYNLSNYNGALAIFITQSINDGAIYERGTTTTNAITDMTMSPETISNLVVFEDGVYYDIDYSFDTVSAECKYFLINSQGDRFYITTDNKIAKPSDN